MKKTIFILIAILTVCTANAQEKKLRWGIKGGLNLTSLSNGDYYTSVPGDGYSKNKHDAKTKPSFYLGGFAEYMADESIAIQPELTYSRQGNMYKKNRGVEEWNRLNYINLAAIMKFYATEKVCLEFGPQVGFNVYSKNVVKFAGREIKEDYDAKTVDFSLCMGASFFLSDHVFFSGRYVLGFTDTNKDNISHKSNCNRVIQLGLGYRF